MKNILFICPNQYGYNTDFYKYCECLSKDYNVYYVGIDMNYKKEFYTENVHICQVKHNEYLCGIISLLTTAWQLSKKISFHKIVIYYCPLASLSIFLFGRKKMIVDIRTAYIGGSFKSKLLNLCLRYETNIFDKISVISYGVANFLKLNRKKCYLLPLGADAGICMQKTNDLRLLYVGTFNDRNIHITIDAIDLFLKQNEGTKLEYYIIGVGNKYEIRKINKAIETCNNRRKIHFVGEVRGKDLEFYYRHCNVGVSYIPLRDYYDNQPPTKTYEYLLNSMSVIATATIENRKVINEGNGVIIEGESAESFADGLAIISRNKYKTDEIFQQNLRYTWDNLTKIYLLPLIES